jgi:hypothetical protein
VKSMKRLSSLIFFASAALAQAQEWKPNPLQATEFFAQATQGELKSLTYVIPGEGFMGEPVLRVISLSADRTFSRMDCSTYLNLGGQGGSYLLQKTNASVMAKIINKFDQDVQAILEGNPTAAPVRQRILSICADHAEAATVQTLTLHLPAVAPVMGVRGLASSNLYAVFKEREGLQLTVTIRK